jgi:hypothetical protein
MTAMKDELAVRTFHSDETVRWSCRTGELVIAVSAKSLFSDNQESGWTIRDFWQMRDGDFVTITNRWMDLPVWFELHPLEVANRAAYEMMKRLKEGYKPKERFDGPNIWRIKSGDRLAWVSYDHGTSAVREIVDFRNCALALGETSNPSLFASLTYGAPDDTELPATIVDALRAGFTQAVALGGLRVFTDEWKFGG